MFFFTVKQTDLKTLQDGERVSIKVNGQPAQVWLGQPQTEVLFQVGEDGPVETRQIVDVGQAGDLVTFVCGQNDQSMTIIRPQIGGQR